MSQSQPNAMQNLVTKLNQMGSGVNAVVGSANSIQPVWNELLQSLDKAIGELQADLKSAREEIQRLTAEKKAHDDYVNRKTVTG